MTASTDQAK